VVVIGACEEVKWELDSDVAIVTGVLIGPCEEVKGELDSNGPIVPGVVIGLCGVVELNPIVLVFET